MDLAIKGRSRIHLKLVAHAFQIRGIRWGIIPIRPIDAIGTFRPRTAPKAPPACHITHTAISHVRELRPIRRHCDRFNHFSRTRVAVEEVLGEKALVHESLADADFR